MGRGRFDPDPFPPLRAPGSGSADGAVAEGSGSALARGFAGSTPAEPPRSGPMERAGERSPPASRDVTPGRGAAQGGSPQRGPRSHDGD